MAPVLIAKSCGEEWKAMDAAQRKPFEATAKKGKKEYDKKKKQYDKKKAKNAPPKRPLSAFFLYLKDQREAVKQSLPDGASVADISREIGKRWRELSEDEKEPYARHSTDLKAEYQKKKAAWDNKMKKKTGAV